MSITKNKQTDLSLHPFKEECTNCEVKEFFLTALNNLDMCVEIVNKNGYLIVSSKGYEKLHNVNQEKVLGKHITEVYDLDENTSVLLTCLKEKKIIKNHYSQYYAKNGITSYSISDAYPIFSNDKVLGSIVIGTDITKVKDISEKNFILQEKIPPQIHPNNENGTQYSFKDIKGSSQAIKMITKTAKKVAVGMSPIMLIGETGTGKELFAQSMHNHSLRNNGSFIAINCSAIPKNLLENLLFGTKKGAFTGAQEKIGLVEEADKGTLFLDEINSMSLSLQQKILRVLETNKVRKLGDNKEIPVDIRIISATNSDPFLAVEKNQLRKDLFYRLAVITLEIPPLRNRYDDIPELTKYFINIYNKLLGKEIKNLSKDVFYIFYNYRWPGNIRELKHVIEYSINMVTNSDNLITTKHIPPYLLEIHNKHTHIHSNSYSNIKTNNFKDAMLSFEKNLLTKTLIENNYNISKSAKQLNISRQHLHKRINKLNIEFTK
jgi:arginine utilization regulatory protein